MNSAALQPRPLLDRAVEDRASNDDRLWFASRPERQYRLRPLLPRELAAKKATHVLVTQVCRGIRYREAIWFNGSVPLDDDCQLGRVAELVRADQAVYIVDGKVFSLEELPVGGQEQ